MVTTFAIGTQSPLLPRRYGVAWHMLWGVLETCRRFRGQNSFAMFYTGIRSQRYSAGCGTSGNQSGDSSPRISCPKPPCACLRSSCV